MSRLEVEKLAVHVQWHESFNIGFYLCFEQTMNYFQVRMELLLAD